MKQTCNNCKFAVPPKGTGLGICRRFPPTVVEDGMGLFPLVGPSDWCGEWEIQIDIQPVDFFNLPMEVENGSN